MIAPALLRPADDVAAGIDLIQRGSLDLALGTLQRLARGNRLDSNAQHAYGCALHVARRFDEAVEQFERTLRLKPACWQAYQNMSASLHGLLRLEEAYAASERALDLNPEYAGAAYHLGDLHLVWGEVEAAIPRYRQAIALDPYVYDYWTGLLFCLDLLSETTGEDALAARREFAARFAPPLAANKRPHPQDRDPERALRIGFISGDFRDHTAAYMFGPIVEHLDRERFEVYAFADCQVSDAITAWFSRHANGWREIQGMSPAAIDRLIRADRIDILVDTAGYTSSSHLVNFIARPAPIQVQAYGYLTGSGLAEMDYVLADDVLVPPEHEHHFSERVLRVPYALGMEPPLRFQLPMRQRDADRPLTFGNLGRAEKIQREAVQLFADTLAAHPGSRMIMKDRGFEWARNRQRVANLIVATGIDPTRFELRGASDRLGHFDVYNEIDVMLDTVPQGGGTTAIESILMGVPVATMLGPRITGRIAATTVQALGKHNWIMADRDDFVRRSGSLARQNGPHLRDELLASIVCDGATRARHVEAVLRDAWREHCEGAP